ncbi:hypothetical protein LTR50_005739 [Elasticomyces elasticus]|nr:hypothetical protein LTR50_005739 [Elasticomyces elasticus]
MAYLFYSITFLFLVVATVLYTTRHHWRSSAPAIPYLTTPGPIPAPLYSLHLRLLTLKDNLTHAYTPLPTSSFSSSPAGNTNTFASDAAAGFHSATFDLSSNIESGDGRAGLDERAKAEVRRLMERRGVAFDEARRLWVEERFGREGIGRDGRPKDPRAFMFS